MKTESGKIKISATNLEIGVHRSISGKIIEDGGITIPFGTFHSIISNTDAERINLETVSGNLLVKTDNYQARIQGIGIDEFPIIPSVQHKDSSIELKSGFLRDALIEIVSAAQFSEIRPELSGVLFDFQATIIKLVATDSFRLAEKTLYTNQFKTNIANGFRAIIPLRTIQEVVRIFPEDQIMKIFFDQNQILFTTEGGELLSRLVSGNYPDYEQIVPKTIETELTIDREKFMNSVRLVSSFSGKVNEIKLRLKDDGRALEVFSSNQYVGENNYLVPAKTKGKGFSDVSFNWRYLIDGLKVVKGETVSFGVNGDSKPAILKAPDDHSYFYILMPIKAV